MHKEWEPNIYTWGASGGGGGKKKGSSGNSPSEAANTLTSNSVVNALFLIGEGELEGVPDLYQAVYLDGVPIKSPSGEFNFKGVKLGYRPGTLTQNYIPSFSAVENETLVNAQVKKSQGAITKTITNPEINAVRLRLLIPQLQRIDSNNNRIDTTSLSFKVEVRTNNGAWVERVRETITGKATSPVEKFYRIDLPAGSVWDIRLTRITDDSQSTSLSNDLFWSSYTQIIDSKFRYPNSALLWVRLSGEQFKSLPRVSIKIKCKKVLIPINYNPYNRSYSGNWTGEFKFQWTNNPAWILFDLLINNRYGCGERVEAENIDKWSFYAIAQYCDELVTSQLPGGAAQPRFTCNAYIRDAQQAYDLLTSIASSFRGSLYWSNGLLFGLQDRPSASVKIFTKANVIEESDPNTGQVTSPAFKYAYTARTARHTVAIISYINPDNDYKPDVEYVEHDDGLSRYGYNPVEIEAFGCYSRDEARRLGHWVLESEQNLTKTVTFSTGAYGAFILPGEVIEIADILKTVKRYGGRLTRSTGGNKIWLDSPIIDPAYGDTVKITSYNGGFSTHSVLNSGSDEYGFFLTITGTANPAENSTFIYSKANLQPQKFRVFSVVDRLMQDKSCYEITATEYNDSIYSTVDYGTPLIIPPTASLPPTVPNAPFNVKAEVSPILREGKWFFDVFIAWEEPLYAGVDDPYTQYYEVQRRVGTAGAWGNNKTSPDPTSQYDGLPEDQHFFRVRSIDILNRSSKWVESVAAILARPKPPNPIGSILKTKTAAGGIVLTWSDTQNYTYGIVGYSIFINGVFIETVPAALKASREIIRPPGSYIVQILALDAAQGLSLSGLVTTLGSEYLPEDPYGEAFIVLRENEFLQLYWSDEITRPADFKIYRIYENNTVLEETRNKFTQPIKVDFSKNYTYKIKAVNNLGYESAGFIELSIGSNSGYTSVPNPAGQIIKTPASDGGIILTWTDTQTYTSFGGYRVYIDGVLVGETKVNYIPSIIRPPGTYNVLVKPINRSGLQSVGGLNEQILPADIFPPSPSFLLVQQTLEGEKQFYWSLPPKTPPDVSICRLRYNVGVNNSWEQSHFLKDLPVSLDKYETSLFRQGIYTILLKLVDNQGNESENLAFTQVNLGDPVPDNVVETWDYRTPANSETGQGSFISRSSWNGNKINLQVNADGDLEVIDPNIAAFYDSDFEVSSSGHLKASEEILGNYALYYERVTQGIMWTGNDSEVFWTAENESLALWKQYDQFLSFPVAVSVDQEEYKVRVHILPSPMRGKIKQLKVFVDAPDIVNTFNDVTISALGTRIVPSKPMTVLKAANLTLQFTSATASAQMLKIIDKDPVTGALVEAYNSQGVRVAAVVDVVLVGY